jgi:antitoxin MazE
VHMKTKPPPKRPVGTSLAKRPSRRAAPRVPKSRALKGKLVPIGNSRGVRLPKAIIELAGLTSDVEIAVRDNQVVISSAKRKNPRAGWEEQIKKALAEHGDDIDEFRDWQSFPNEFDEKEWTW